MQILTNDKISLFILKTQGVCVYVCIERETITEKQRYKDRETETQTDTHTDF